MLVEVAQINTLRSKLLISMAVMQCCAIAVFFIFCVLVRGGREGREGGEREGEGRNRLDGGREGEMK